MRLNLGGTVGTKTLLRITIQKSGQEVPSSWRNDLGAWEVKRFGQDLPVHLIRILVIERRQASEHLIE